MRNENRKTNEKKRKEERQEPTRKDKMSAKRREGMRERENKGSERRDEERRGGRWRGEEVCQAKRENCHKEKYGEIETGSPVNQSLWAPCQSTSVYPVNQFLGLLLLGASVNQLLSSKSINS